VTTPIAKAECAVVEPESGGELRPTVVRKGVVWSDLVATFNTSCMPEWSSEISKGRIFYLSVYPGGREVEMAFDLSEADPWTQDEIDAARKRGRELRDSLFGKDTR